MNYEDREACLQWFESDKVNDKGMLVDLVLSAWQAACEWRDSQVGEPVGYIAIFNDTNFYDGFRQIRFDKPPFKSSEEGTYFPVYTAPPTAQINQQMLEALEAFINAWGDCLGHPDTENERFRLSEARDKAESAVLAAATQMRGDA